VFDATGRLVCRRCSMRFGSYANYVQHKRLEDRLLASPSRNATAADNILGIGVAADTGHTGAVGSTASAAGGECTPTLAASTAPAVAVAATAVPRPAPTQPPTHGAVSVAAPPTASLAGATRMAAAVALTGAVDPAGVRAAGASGVPTMASDTPPLPPTLPPMPPQFPLPVSTSSTIVADRIARHYRTKGDMSRTALYVPAHLRDRPSEFLSKEHKEMRLFALTAGGCGLSQKAREEYYETAVAVERAAMQVVAEIDARRRRRKKGKNGKGKKRNPIVRLGPLESAFPTAAAFVRSLKGEQWRCLSELKWRETDIIIRGVVYKFYSRDVMQVATDAMVSAIKVCLHGKRQLNEAGEVVRTNSLNSDIYLEEQADVHRLHAGKMDNGKKMPPFTLAIQLFSDAALVSWNGSMLPPVCFLAFSTCLPAFSLACPVLSLIVWE